MTATWQDILILAGFPTEIIVLDFEIYFDSEYNLSKLSGVEYVMDPRFEVEGLGYQTLGDGSTVGGFLAPDEVGPYLAALAPHIDSYTVVGQYLAFDALILREKYGITPKYTVDILDLARHLDARDRHDLDHLAQRYLSPPLRKGDTKQFAGLHWGSMSEPQRVALSSYCKNDVTLEVELLKTLLPRITRPEAELRLAAQTLRMFLVPQIKIDTDLGRWLVVDMNAELQKPVDLVNALGVKVITPPKKTRKGRVPPVVKAVTVADISKDSTFLSLLRSALPTGEGVPMKTGKRGLIPALAKGDEQLNYLLSHPCPVVRALMEARKASDSWPTHISRVHRLIDQALARGGYMGAPLTYYAAHTGRYGGTGGTNFQNFGARDVHDLIKQVGQMLCAPEGYILGTGDLSQIEARVVAWFAGQDDLLQAFASGRDVYSEFAQEQIYHKETRKPRPEDPPDLARALKTRRDVGKETILGAGFGMGGATFYERCKQKPSLRAAFESGDLTPELCLRAIAVYRQRYAMIPKFWQEVEKAWRFVAKYPDQRATVSHYGRALTFWNACSMVVVQLPSSRCLFYPHARVGVGGECDYHWGHLWGGAIVENVVQATARDVFTDGLLRLEDAGFNLLFSVHDQAIVLIKQMNVHQLADMHRLQCVVPAWAEGLPVATEGELTSRYHK
jgi:DNA polymerase bacteriophage-type